MNPEHDPRLEAAVDRALKSLPELEAPVTLAPRVMAALRQRRSVPWYSQPWPVWPVGLRATSLGIMLAFFAGLCFASWNLSEAGSVATTMRDVSGWMSGWGVICRTINTLFGAATVVVGKLGTGIIIASLLVAVINYAACVGLGTMFVRFAFVRPRN